MKCECIFCDIDMNFRKTTGIYNEFTCPQCGHSSLRPVADEKEENNVDMEQK
ncbi:putative RNA-binding Zn-ribbon protein involved in translation (DUF1610 family) [Elusimicrobium simillimum]|uniref:hypothetical protein n=1 Tax=Elusimicrobium simillimum TaxID=3143438 RepID=UPI003C6EA598